MNHASFKRAQMAFVSLLLACGLLSASPAAAYNEKTHQTMTKVAFDIMRLVAYEQKTNKSFVPYETSLATPPPGVAAAEWKMFIDAVSNGTWRILRQKASLPNYGTCGGVAGKRLFELPKLDPEFVMEYNFQYLDKERDGKNKCQQAQHKRGPLFSKFNVAFPHGSMAGSALGVHAAAPDRYNHDWYVFHDYFQSYYMGQVFDVLDAVNSIGYGVAVAPFYCMARLIKGRGLCGWNDVKDFSDRVNPDPQVRGIISAPFSLASYKIPGDWGTGIGHLMNYSPAAQNVFDDIEGFHQERSGWRGRIGVTDMMIMVAGDLAGLCVDPRESNGARDYEICDGSGFCGDNEVRDGHKASSRRTNPYWRASTLGHQAFTPLDNLAYYGWQKALNYNFPGVGPGAPIEVTVEELARPLHALGDIAAPHHLIAGLGWGHRIYEPMIEEFWEEIQTVDNPKVSEATQYRAARSILARAFVWYKYVLEARKGGELKYANDVPVRDMISEMGARNYSFIVSGDEMKYSNFRKKVPFLDHPARVFPFIDRVHRDGGKESQRFVKEWLANDKAGIQWLIDSGIGGTLAFLTASSDWMKPVSCGDGMVTGGEACDDDNDKSGDGCSNTCQVEPGWQCDVAWPSFCDRIIILI